MLFRWYHEDVPPHAAVVEETAELG
jgi:hypothetical protein